MIDTTGLGRFGSFLLIVSFLYSCSRDPGPKTTDDGLWLKINLKSEPDHLNPIVSQQLSSRQLERFIFCPLEEYNPTTLLMEPMLLEDRPIITKIDTGTTEGSLRFDMQILSEARWDNGSPVTGYDYLFTIKTALLPNLSRSNWSSFLQIIDSIEVDRSNPKHLTVYTDTPSMMAEEIVCGFSIYPQHIYDPDSTLASLSFSYIKKMQPDQMADHLKQRLDRFARRFSSSEFSREKVQGGGPYLLREWTANQQIVLEKKVDYWGDLLEDKHPFLMGIPQRMTYYLIPDEQTAFTNLKDGRLDIASDLSPEQLNALAHDTVNHNLLTYTPPVLQYYYIAYNTSRPALADVRVRRALSHILDTKAIIDQLFYGHADPTIGPVNPAKPYYNDTIAPIPYDPMMAKALLDSSGWRDLDQDGILDKRIKGEVVTLRFKIFTSRSALSQDVAILLQQNSRKVGIDIEIIPQDPNVYIPEVRQGDYDLATLAVIQSVGDFDPYNSWHSDNSYPGGSNLSKLQNAELDELIETLRSTVRSEERRHLYLRLQEIIFEQQPALFLMAPKMRVAAKANLKLTISTMRPGYFENLTTLQ